jgi:hypothetical protein
MELPISGHYRYENVCPLIRSKFKRESSFGAKEKKRVLEADQ